MDRGILEELSAEELRENYKRLLPAIENLNTLLGDMELEHSELLEVNKELVNTLDTLSKQSNFFDKVMHTAKAFWTNFDKSQVHSEDIQEWNQIMAELGD